jgi:hypothetical protein
MSTTAGTSSGDALIRASQQAQERSVTSPTVAEDSESEDEDAKSERRKEEVVKALVVAIRSRDKVSELLMGIPRRT